MSHYYVYFLTNKTNEVLYIGVTNDLERRLYEHKIGLYKGFSHTYRTHKLVYCEVYGDINEAIAREKQLKKWRREKKNFLVNKENQGWLDLSESWNKPDPSTAVLCTFAQDDSIDRKGKV